MITIQTIWDAIVAADQDVEHQDPPGQLSPPETLAILEYVFRLASENRPLSLADYRAFYARNWEESLIASNIIRSAIDTILSTPIPYNDRSFLNHLSLCAAYLANQGYQGLDDGRDHWPDVLQSFHKKQDALAPLHADLVRAIRPTFKRHLAETACDDCAALMTQRDVLEVLDIALDACTSGVLHCCGKHTRDRDRQ